MSNKIKAKAKRVRETIGNLKTDRIFDIKELLNFLMWYWLFFGNCTYLLEIQYEIFMHKI